MCTRHVHESGLDAIVGSQASPGKKAALKRHWHAICYTCTIAEVEEEWGAFVGMMGAESGLIKHFCKFAPESTQMPPRHYAAAYRVSGPAAALGEGKCASMAEVKHSYINARFVRDGSDGFYGISRATAYASTIEYGQCFATNGARQEDREVAGLRRRPFQPKPKPPPLTLSMGHLAPRQAPS